MSGAQLRGPLTIELKHTLKKTSGRSPSLYEQRQAVLQDVLLDAGVYYSITAPTVWDACYNLPHTGTLCDVWNAMKAALDKILDLPGFIWNTLSTFFAKAYDTLKDLVKAVIDPVWQLITTAFDKLKDVITQVVGGIAESLKKVGEVVWDTIKNVGEWLLEFLKKYWPIILIVLLIIIAVVIDVLTAGALHMVIWNFLKPIISWVGGAAEDIFRIAKDSVIDISKLLGQVYGFVGDLWSKTIQPVMGGMQASLAALVPITELIPEKYRQKFADPLFSMMGKLGTIDTWLQAHVGSHIEDLHKKVDTLRTALVAEQAAFAQIHSGVMTAEGIYNRLSYSEEAKNLRSTLGYIFDKTGDRLRYELRSQVSAETVAKQMVFEDPWQQLASDIDLAAGIRKSNPDLTDDEVQKGIEIMKRASQNTKSAQWKGVSDKAWDFVINAMCPNHPVEPAYADDNANAAYLWATGAGVGAHLLATAAEAFYPTKELGFGYLAAFVAQTAGWALITNQSIGQLYRIGIGIPWRYRLNEKYRPELPGIGQLTEMALEREIRIEDWRTAMTWHGWRNEWIEAYEKTMWDDPNYRALSQMADGESMDTTWLASKVMQTGVETADIDPMAKAVIHMATKSQRTGYQMALLNLYAEGLMSDAQFDELLNPLELRPEAHKLLKKTGDFKFLMDYANSLTKFYQDLFSAGEMSEEDLYLALLALGYRPERAQLIRDAAILKSRKTVANKEKAGVESVIRKQQQLIIQKYVAAFRAGSFDKDALIGYLMAAGIDTTLAVATAELEKQKSLLEKEKEELHSVDSETRKIQANYEKLYCEQYREGLITDAQFKSNLMALGYTEELADSIVEFEKIKKGGTVKVLRDADYPRRLNELQANYVAKYRMLYRKKKIKLEQWRSFMYQLGMKPDDIESTIQHELELRKLYAP